MAVLKNVRALVLFKFSLREMLILLHPRAVRTVKVNNRSIPDRMALTVMSFIFIYFMTVIVFSFLLMAAGLDFLSAFTAVIACITNAGPGLGAVGPSHNYAVLSDVLEMAVYGGDVVGTFGDFYRSDFANSGIIGRNKCEKKAV